MFYDKLYLYYSTVERIDNTKKARNSLAILFINPELPIPINEVYNMPNTNDMSNDELDLWSDINNPNNDADMDDWSDAHNPNNDDYLED